MLLELGALQELLQAQYLLLRAHKIYTCCIVNCLLVAFMVPTSFILFVMGIISIYNLLIIDIIAVGVLVYSVAISKKADKLRLEAIRIGAKY